MPSKSGCHSSLKSRWTTSMNSPTGFRSGVVARSGPSQTSHVLHPRATIFDARLREMRSKVSRCAVMQVQKPMSTWTVDPE